MLQSYPYETFMRKYKYPWKVLESKLKYTGTKNATRLLVQKKQIIYSLWVDILNVVRTKASDNCRLFIIIIGWQRSIIFYTFNTTSSICPRVVSQASDRGCCGVITSKTIHWCHWANAGSVHGVTIPIGKIWNRATSW